MNVKENTVRWFQRGSTALADQVIFALSGFASNILLARWFALDQYGAYALAFSIYLFLSSFHNAMLLEPMSVLGPASYRNSLPEYLGRLVPLHLAVTIVPALLVGIGGSVFGFVTKSSVVPPALWGACIGTPCMLFFWLWRRAAYLELQPKIALRGAVVNTALVILLLFVAHWQGWLTPFTAFMLQSFAGIAASLVLMISLRPRLRFRWMDDAMHTILRQHWQYGRWVVVTAFVFWLAGDAYYVIVASSASIRDVAILRAIQNFVRPISQFTVAVTLLLVPWASGRFADRDDVTFRRGINRVTMIFTAGAIAYLIALAVAGKWLTQFVYSGKYTEFAYLLPLMTLPVLFGAAAEGPAIAVRAMQVPAEIFWAYAAAAVPTLLFGIFFARHWGIMGAAIGLSISGFAYFLVLTYRYRVRLSDMIPAPQPSHASFSPEAAPTVEVQ